VSPGVSATDDLILLLDRLRTDHTLQAQFRANPRAAVADFELTPHERDAVITRDLDDFVALGVVSSISELPEALRGTRGGPTVVDVWAGVARELRDILTRFSTAVLNPQPRPQPPRPEPPRPEPPGPEPRPRPEPPDPRPGPDPPGPRPGPDPPGPGD
jgi:hypothetical protein